MTCGLLSTRDDRAGSLQVNEQRIAARIARQIRELSAIIREAVLLEKALQVFEKQLVGRGGGDRTKSDVEGA